ncbi:hypothetical protein C475_18496 [Halosimplex carlsbadense 2-9-1]|uniref:Halobacterial output domain-containing protein n=1 Tax=Halosimplex carlsbadense 2-9-1 TaxID=797114 RepID=M0CIP2_9EURY|nr:hypothetical protein [Halosimplex carlsbadense]ELZ21764.1 hypothetical protein C475_18496 [Halosimplex carlsbadense 2-9-1]
MSYEHLAGRLIETQRSMLGPSAVDIARSIGGIAVDDDGTVTEIGDDKRAAVDTLARRYVDMLGDAAESRLRSAAREFEDELLLPPSLGGPDPSERPRHDRAAPGPGTAASPSAGHATGAVSDGGTVAVGPSPTDDEFSDAIDRTNGVESGGPSGDDSEVDTVSEPVTVEYTVASDLSGVVADDLDSVYLLPESGDGWQAPISVERAVVDLVSETATVSDATVAGVVDAIDPMRLVATLDGDAGETVSFVHDGIAVTFHRSGSLAVH